MNSPASSSVPVCCTWNKGMTDKLLDSSILLSKQDSLDFITSVLQSRTEYSITGQADDLTILLGNEGES
jgi:hypothetical protein